MRIGNGPLSALEVASKHCCSAARWLALLVLPMVMAACSGGSSGGEGPPDSPPSSGGYSVQVTVSGLQLASNEYAFFVLHYQDANGAEQYGTMGANADGPFVFTEALPNGSSYRVEFRDTSDFSAKCTVENGSGVIASANVTDVTATCVPSYTVGGTITGSTMNLWSDLQLEVLHNGVVAPDYTLLFDRSSDRFTSGGDRGFLTGDSYEVRVRTQPSENKECKVRRGSGVIADAHVTDVEINCGDAEISFTVEGLTGTGLDVGLWAEVENNGNTQMLLIEHDAISADGVYTFDTLLSPGEPYEVRVYEQPTDPNQECRVEHGVGTISGDVTDVEVNCPLPLRRWRFDNANTRFKDVPLKPAGEQLGGVVYDDFRFASAPAVSIGSATGLDITELFKLHLDPPGPGGIVYSNQTGETYWISVLSGNRVAVLGDVGELRHQVKLETVWRFRKVSASTSFRLQLTAINLLGVDDTHYVGDSQNGWVGSLLASADLEVNAYHAAGFETQADSFFSAQGSVFLEGTRDEANTARTVWDLDTITVDDVDLNLLSKDDFRLDPTVGVGAFIDKAAHGYLNKTIPIEIDLSDVPVGSEFVVVSTAYVEAQNTYTNEGGAIAFLQDPASFDPGVDPVLPGGGVGLVETEGVVLVDVGEVPPLDLVRATALQPPAPACDSSESPRSTLAFDAPEYRVSEGGELPRGVRVTSSGEAEELVTARVSLTSASATEGNDFDARQIEVRFGAGSNAPRTLSLPIIDDDVIESDETFTVTLHDPAGCALLGEQSSAVVTIVDNDSPPPTPESYSIGGTVTGLAGTGLTLTMNSTNDLVVEANGAFSFERTFAGGVIYNVRVAAQPATPNQICSVANGTGTIVDADITDIDVTCELIDEPVGQLDPAFGTGGLLTDAAVGGATDMSLQPDGRLVIAGRYALARFNSDGSIDTGFGSNGQAAVNYFGVGNDWTNSVALQSDGGILVAGYTRDGVNSPVQEDFAIARFDASGMPDIDFGDQGRTIVDFDSRGDAAYDLLLQGDGGIVVTGNASIQNQFGISESDFAAVGLSASGAINTSFGTDGQVNTNVAGRTDLGYASALQSDGGIVIAGRVADSGGDNPDIGLVRYNADGSLDTSFGVAGIVRDQTVEWDEAFDLIIQPDGRIVVVGQVLIPVPGSPTTTANLVVARYNSDGSIDTAFGSNGRFVDPVMEVGRAIASLPDGRLVVAGRASGNFIVIRLDSLGTIDTTLGVGGTVEIDFFGGTDTPEAIAIQPDGRILVAGSAVSGTSTMLGIARIIQ